MTHDEIELKAFLECLFQHPDRHWSKDTDISMKTKPLFLHFFEHGDYGFHRYSDEKLSEFQKTAGIVLQEAIAEELDKRQANRLSEKHCSGTSRQRETL